MLENVVVIVKIVLKATKKDNCIIRKLLRKKRDGKPETKELRHQVMSAPVFYLWCDGPDGCAPSYSIANNSLSLLVVPQKNKAIFTIIDIYGVMGAIWQLFCTKCSKRIKSITNVSLRR